AEGRMNIAGSVIVAHRAYLWTLGVVVASIGIVERRLHKVAESNGACVPNARLDLLGERVHRSMWPKQRGAESIPCASSIRSLRVGQPESGQAGSPSYQALRLQSLRLHPAFRNPVRARRPLD